MMMLIMVPWWSSYMHSYSSVYSIDNVYDVLGIRMHYDDYFSILLQTNEYVIMIQLWD